MILGLDEAVMLDASKIKVIDGIAGAAKSSALHKFLCDNSITYTRLTSTHRLAQDAAERYGMEVSTICSGLFESPDGKFYEIQKPAPSGVVVIDEILQSDPRAIQWCIDHVGECNIIVTTDSRQMLAPESERKMKRAFEELKKHAVVSELNYSLRPRTDDTRDLYDAAYASVGADANAYDAAVKTYGTIPNEYDAEAVYICHTKELEQYLYNLYSLRARYDIPLTGKGELAHKRPKDITIYPILPQCEAKGRYYWQASNIATPTRYQGSEVEQGRRCYYLVEKSSYVCNREWYTVISRLWDIRDLRVCVIDVPRVQDIDKFAGYPVLEYQTVNIKSDIDLTPGKRGVYYADPVELAKVINASQVGDGYAPKPRRAIINGMTVVARPSAPTGNQKTMASLLKKEGTFSYPHTPDMLRAMEAWGCVYPRMTGPCPKSQCGKYRYSLDLKAAYPHILCFERLPTGDRFALSPFAGSMDWYIHSDDDIMSSGILPGDALSHMPGLKADYIFSTSCQQGSKMGTWLHDQAHRSQESKLKIKSIHYGYAMRQYLNNYRDPVTHKMKGFARDRDNLHALLMCAVVSYEAARICDMRRIIYGNLTGGSVKADCLNFDSSFDLNTIGDTISAAMPNYDFRITDNLTGDIVYKTYQDEPTERELRNCRKYRKTPRGR